MFQYLQALGLFSLHDTETRIRLLALMHDHIRNFVHTCKQYAFLGPTPSTLKYVFMGPWQSSIDYRGCQIGQHRANTTGDASRGILDILEARLEGKY